MARLDSLGNDKRDTAPVQDPELRHPLSALRRQRIVRRALCARLGRAVAFRKGHHDEGGHPWLTAPWFH